MTCQGLRALTIGMSMGDVEKEIGLPVYRTPGEETSSPADEEFWTMKRRGCSAASYMEFKQGRLKNVDAYRRYTWDERSKLLFWLVRTGERRLQSFPITSVVPDKLMVSTEAHRIFGKRAKESVRRLCQTLGRRSPRARGDLGENRPRELEESYFGCKS